MSRPAPRFEARGLVLHVPILTYHVIAPWAIAAAYARPNLVIDPAVFDAQLHALHDSGWHAITVATLASALARGAELPPKTFAIAIDDGHGDGATYALPILLRYGDVATFYVVAGRVGQPDNLTWAQLAQLAADGMEIGDHTLQHLALTGLPIAEAEAQVGDAQARFVAGLGMAPTTFAYPFGAFDPAVVGVVERAGFAMGVTTARGAVETWDQRFEVPRFEVGVAFSPATVVAIVRPYQ